MLLTVSQELADKNSVVSQSLILIDLLVVRFTVDFGHVHVLDYEALREFSDY